MIRLSDLLFDHRRQQLALRSRFIGLQALSLELNAKVDDKNSRSSFQPIDRRSRPASQSFNWNTVSSQSSTVILHYPENVVRFELRTQRSSSGSYVTTISRKRFAIIGGLSAALEHAVEQASSESGHLRVFTHLAWSGGISLSKDIESVSRIELHTTIAGEAELQSGISGESAVMEFYRLKPSQSEYAATQIDRRELTLAAERAVAQRVTFLTVGSLPEELSHIALLNSLSDEQILDLLLEHQETTPQICAERVLARPPIAKAVAVTSLAAVLFVAFVHACISEANAKSATALNVTRDRTALLQKQDKWLDESPLRSHLTSIEGRQRSPLLTALLFAEQELPTLGVVQGLHYSSLSGENVEPAAEGLSEASQSVDPNIANPLKKTAEKPRFGSAKGVNSVPEAQIKYVLKCTGDMTSEQAENRVRRSFAKGDNGLRTKIRISPLQPDGTIGSQAEKIEISLELREQGLPNE